VVKKGWSREETDNLFDLCEQFDLRFIIIADRFTPPRTVEELKGRYYSGVLLSHPLEN
jgi:DNA methyltransferase 1-associated protein 1